VLQGRLFDEEAVGTAPIPDRVRALAARLPGPVRLGTSSWSFPGWRGIVYDRPAPEAQLAREGLAAYARHPLLRTVSLDRTYYAPLAAAVFAAYAAQVPEGFRFLVKAASQCTSPREPTFLDPAFATEQVVGPCLEGLGERAGPLVFQFPPLPPSFVEDPQRFAERLHAFLDALPRGPLVAVEVRDRRLLGRAYAEALAAAGAWPCLSLHPRLPALAEQRAMTGAGLDGPLIVRWMLHPGRAYDEARAVYAPFDRLQEEDPAGRESVADLAAAHLARGHEVYVTINNKAEGSAPLSVLRLAERLVARLTA
jgi:uncharacterized protein YecE (DUF72 family)